jgi:hypothetical protein
VNPERPDPFLAVGDRTTGKRLSVPGSRWTRFRIRSDEEAFRASRNQLKLEQRGFVPAETELEDPVIRDRQQFQQSQAGKFLFEGQIKTRAGHPRGGFQWTTLEQKYATGRVPERKAELTGTVRGVPFEDPEFLVKTLRVPGPSWNEDPLEGAPEQSLRGETRPMRELRVAQCR